MNRKLLKIFLLFCLTLCFNGFCFNGLTSIQAQEKKEASLRPKKKKYYLSICAIFRDEARFLKEWIEFHRLVGVEHFYLMNHLSTDDYQKVLEPYIKKNIVELQNWNYPITSPGRWSPIQTSAYQKIIKRSAKKTEWLAILDTDEFLFPVQEKNLKEFLKKYEEFSAVCVNWQMFGTSGISRVPDNELMIDFLTLSAPTNYHENIHVKSIVRPSHVETCLNPHYCKLLPGCYQVTEKMEKFEGPFSPSISVEKIRINHYWSRDEDFFYNVKIARRGRWGEGADGCLRRNENINKKSDFIIFRFSEDLRKMMFK